ncbi:hypothetical protein LguiA_029056 [Lonicera macranthoides]
MLTSRTNTTPYLSPSSCILTAMLTNDLLQRNLPARLSSHPRYIGSSEQQQIQQKPSKPRFFYSSSSSKMMGKLRARKKKFILKTWERKMI